MAVINFTIWVGIATAMYVLIGAPHSKWFERLNSFESNTTLEDIIEESRKEDNEY